MAEVVCAAVEVYVDEPLAVDVVDEVAVPPVDDQRHTRVDPELVLSGFQNSLDFASISALDAKAMRSVRCAGCKAMATSAGCGDTVRAVTRATTHRL